MQRLQTRFVSARFATFLNFVFLFQRLYTSG